MTKRESSPVVLSRLWATYAARYHRNVGQPMSKRDFCNRLDWKPNRLAKWTSSTSSNSRRIPLEHMDKLAEAMMLGPADRDRLMMARIREICAADASTHALVMWMGARYKDKSVNLHHLEEDEKGVLAAYRVAKEGWALGLTGSDSEMTSLVAHFQAQLERAAVTLSQSLNEEVEQIAAEEAIADVDMLERIERAKAQLAQMKKPKALFIGAIDRAKQQATTWKRKAAHLDG